MARPKGSNFTQEMGDEILAGIAEGNSLRTVLKAEGMPCMSTVFKWLREEAGFSENYEKALVLARTPLAKTSWQLPTTPKTTHTPPHTRMGSSVHRLTPSGSADRGCELMRANG